MASRASASLDAPPVSRSEAPAPQAPAGSQAVIETMCRNCERPFHGVHAQPRFCPQCGQSVDAKEPTLREFARKFIADNLLPGGILWRTLALLVAQPGRLTTLHRLGRRTRYLPPMKLYLGASFVFFLVLKFIAGSPDVPVVVGHINFGMLDASSAAPRDGAVLFTSSGLLPTIVVTLESARVPRDPAMFRAMDARASQCLQAGRDDCGWLERLATRAARRWAADPGTAQMGFVRHALDIAPYEVFLMLPLYAVIVAIACRGSHRRFGDHMTFGCHLHAFWFLAAAVALLLPRAAVVGVAACVGWHALRSLHEAYGGSWRGVALRGVAISVAYALVFLAVTLATSFCLFVG